MKLRLCTFMVVSLSIVLLAGGGASLSAQPAASSALPSRSTVQLSNEEIFGYVQDLTSIGYRRTGTPAGKRPQNTSGIS